MGCSSRCYKHPIPFFCFSGPIPPPCKIYIWHISTFLVQYTKSIMFYLSSLVCVVGTTPTRYGLCSITLYKYFLLNTPLYFTSNKNNPTKPLLIELHQEADLLEIVPPWKGTRHRLQAGRFAALYRVTEFRGPLLQKTFRIFRLQQMQNYTVPLSRQWNRH